MENKKNSVNILELTNQGNNIPFYKNQENIWFVIFLLSAFILAVIPQTASVLKYSLIPLSIIALYKYDTFDYLIFPLSFLDNTIGTLIFGRLTIMLLYLMLLLCKLYLFRLKQLKFRIIELMLIIITTAYYLFAYSEYSNNSIKLIMIILCGTVIAKRSFSSKDKMRKLVNVIFLSSMLPAITLAFGFLGNYKTTDRMSGIGFNDPNYSSFLCLMGLCVALNSFEGGKKIKTMLL